MDHIVGQLQTFLAWWFISVNVLLPRSLSVHAVCLLISPSCCLVCSFDTIPSYWFYCNEWNSKLWCIILDFMLYLLCGQKKQHRKRSKNTTDLKQRFFFPSCIFLRCCKRLYFSISLELLTVMQNLGRASVPSEHRANSGYSFYVFIKGFQRWNYILLFSVWIVLLFLSILHFKNKTLILLYPFLSTFLW